MLGPVLLMPGRQERAARDLGLALQPPLAKAFSGAVRDRPQRLGERLRVLVEQPLLRPLLNRRLVAQQQPLRVVPVVRGLPRPVLLAAGVKLLAVAGDPRRRRRAAVPLPADRERLLARLVQVAGQRMRRVKHGALVNHPRVERAVLLPLGNRHQRLLALVGRGGDLLDDPCHLRAGEMLAC